MLAFISADKPGEANRLLAEIRTVLEGEGLRLAGAVQQNVDTGGPKCDMDLHILSMDRVIRISQNLGALSQGCRLDPEGVAQAAALAEQVLSDGAAFAIVNKFGKAEAEGRGFRAFIGHALAQGVPVLTAVGPANQPAFRAFAEGLAQELPSDPAQVLAWCRAQMAQAGA